MSSVFETARIEISRCSRATVNQTFRGSLESWKMVPVLSLKILAQDLQLYLR
jgi:hypothetical protein